MTTNFEKLKSMSVNELAEWLDKYGQYDGSPWTDWFNNTYCSKCEHIVMETSDEQEICGLKPPWLSNKIELAFCECEHKCRYFTTTTYGPDNKAIIEMWLNEELSDEHV